MGDLATTNTFVSGATAVASEVNTNFSDVVNYINARNTGVSKWDSLKTSGNASIDGTLTVTGAASFASTLSVGSTDVVAAVASLTDGWVAAGETWTYASATTFTISGDKTGKYSKGDKIKFAQSGQKYFYIIGVSYSAPDTTVTVCGGDTYSIANAAITSPYYSKSTSPSGFPGYFYFTFTSVSGFSSISYSEGYFTLDGTALTVGYNFLGTSNSTSLTGVMPFSVRSAVLSLSSNVSAGQTQNNTVFESGGYATMASNVMTCRRYNTNLWTASGTKQCTGFSLGLI